MSYEHLKASWRAEVEAIVRAELGKMESEIARMHHQVEQSFTHLLSQSAARLAAVSHDAAIADFAERVLAHMAAVSTAATAPAAPAAATAPPPPAEAPAEAAAQAADAVPAQAAGAVADGTQAALPDQAPLPAGIDLQALYYYMVEIQCQPAQAEALNLLVARAAEYAPRVALFVVKAGSITAWAERGFETAGVSLRGLAIPLQAQTTLLAALERQTAVLESPYAYAENQLLLDRLGSAPEAMAGIPLLVRGKAAAVLYADTSDQSVASVALAPLQILVNVAGLTVELINTRNRLATIAHQVAAPAEPQPAQAGAAVAAPAAKATSEPPQAEPPQAAEAPAAAETEAASSGTLEAQAEEAQAEVAAPPAEAAAFVPAEAPASEAPPAADYANGVTAEAAPVQEPVASSAMPEFIVTPTEAAKPEPTFEPQPIPPTVPLEPLVQTPVTPTLAAFPEPAADRAEPPAAEAASWQAEPAAPGQSFASPVFDLSREADPTPKAATADPAPDHDHANGFDVKPLAPLAATAPAETKATLSAPPKPATDEEVKAHNDARRFARLLVSEIKLYNEAKVTEGRINRDLYDRLKEDIDRSRQMYDKRVNPIVAAKFDYFYDELVSSLAEGDSSRLGGDCPGPILVQPE